MVVKSLDWLLKTVENGQRNAGNMLLARLSDVQNREWVTVRLGEETAVLKVISVDKATGTLTLRIVG